MLTYSRRLDGKPAPTDMDSTVAQIHMAQNRKEKETAEADQQEIQQLRHQLQQSPN